MRPWHRGGEGKGEQGEERPEPKGEGSTAEEQTRESCRKNKRSQEKMEREELK